MRLLLFIGIFLFSSQIVKADVLFLNCKSGSVLRSFSIDLKTNKVFDPERSEIKKVSDSEVIILQDPSDFSAFLTEFQINRIKNSVESFFVNKKDINDKALADGYECKEASY